ncbi:MAG TPA: hypothetical protein VLH10_00415 [Yinghuangia sp.]|uniref:hypothetical protein n=1 Tax=Yinghuangia sp. YIM S10712 TaxID=3436930 RepID=UPI002CF35849|nr:hypothetical protein [Yinghuangia sp.]
MTLHGCAVRWVVGRFVGVDVSYRDEVAATALESTADAGRWDRLAEVSALVGLALRLRWRHRTAGREDRTWRQGLCLGALSVPVVFGVGQVSGAGGVLLGIAAPALLLVLGRFDPRLAAAALVVWFWRLVVGDLGGLATALATPAEDGRVALLARWFLMASGVGVAWVVTRRSIRRLNAI